LWFIVDILILLIVEAVCIKEAVIVGGNALSTSGRKIKSIKDFRVGISFGKNLPTCRKSG